MIEINGQHIALRSITSPSAVCLVMVVVTIYLANGVTSTKLSVLEALQVEDFYGPLFFVPLEAIMASTSNIYFHVLSECRDSITLRNPVKYE